MEHISLVKLLHGRLPVGIKEAADLLQSTGGDIKQAAQIWINKLAGNLVEQTGITPEEAKDLLENTGMILNPPCSTGGGQMCRWCS